MSLLKCVEPKFECREFRESVLGVMPHHWVSIECSSASSFCYSFLNIHKITYVELFHNQDRREDTSLDLAHFRRHKRKTVKKTPGRTTNYPFHKPEENHPPGIDTSKKISKAIGKAVNYAKSAKPKKVNFIMLSS